jgi:glycosyltransferase involved in cell wall biosynthesis
VSGEKDWYDAMKALIESPQLRVKMGEAAYKNVKDNYTIQAHIEDYAKFFKNLLTE